MEDRRFEVMSLAMAVFSLGADNYGHDFVPSVSLSLDLALENRSPASEAHLLQMPAVFLTRLVELLPHEAMDALAYVNSDCRQLVRSRRFASVHLSFSLRCIHLLNLLMEEGSQRASNNFQTQRPALGACIRRLTVATNAANFRLLNNLDDWQRWNFEKEEYNPLLDKAINTYYEGYLKNIELILHSRALPHLQLIDFEDRVTIPIPFYTALMSTSLRHLKLFRVRAPRELETQLIQILQQKQDWLLQSLHLETWGRSSDPSTSTQKLCQLILQACCRNLQSLVWVPNSGSTTDIAFDPGTEFPRLHYLNLGRHKFAHDGVLRVLIYPQSQIRSLTASIDYDEVSSQFFAQCEPLRSLETFVWEAYRTPQAASLKFLEANNHIRTFSMWQAMEVEFLDLSLLPALAKSFHKLRSLRLAWRGTTISETALFNISKITSLEQVCISVGCQAGQKHEWQINHQTLRKHLEKLPALRKLALERDSYPDSSPDHDHESNGLALDIPVQSYYQSLRRPQNRAEHQLERNVFAHLIANLQSETYADNFEQATHRISELFHRRRILREAGKYAKLLPKLEWMYVGQLPIRISESPYDHGTRVRRKAIALADERSDCFHLLDRTFGAESCMFEILRPRKGDLMEGKV